jgi:hypothetical protein
MEVQPDLRGGGDEFQLGVSNYERVTAAEREAVKNIPPSCRKQMQAFDLLVSANESRNHNPEVEVIMATATVTFAPSVSKPRLWTGRVLTGLVVLFLAFDGLMKVLKEKHVLAAIAEMGIPVATIVWIGALLLACTALYAIPRTAVVGAILLTGYLGGAVFANVIAKHPAFECWFPVGFGVITWLGLYLREPRLWELAPLRKD